MAKLNTPKVTITAGGKCADVYSGGVALGVLLHKILGTGVGFI